VVLNVGSSQGISMVPWLQVCNSESKQNGLHLVPFEYSQELLGVWEFESHRSTTPNGWGDVWDGGGGSECQCLRATRRQHFPAGWRPSSCREFFHLIQRQLTGDHLSWAIETEEPPPSAFGPQVWFGLFFWEESEWLKRINNNVNIRSSRFRCL